MRRIDRDEGEFECCWQRSALHWQRSALHWNETGPEGRPYPASHSSTDSPVLIQEKTSLAFATKFGHNCDKAGYDGDP
jgi:hypothetical protein